MSKIITLTVIHVLALVFSLQAQTAKITHIRSEDDLADGYGGIRIYKYAAFQAGKVYFRDGDSSGGRMNLNYLKGTMDFIAPKGDTMSLMNEETVKRIVINTDTFLYENGFLQVVKQTARASLGIKKKIKIADRQKIGAFGIPTSTGNIEAKEAIIENQTLNLKKNENIVLVEEYSYYISDAKTPYVEATRKNIIRLFAEKKVQLGQYMDSRNMNVKNEEELKSLVDYLSSVK